MITLAIIFYIQIISFLYNLLAFYTSSSGFPSTSSPSEASSYLIIHNPFLNCNFSFVVVPVILNCSTGKGILSSNLPNSLISFILSFSSFGVFSLFLSPTTVIMVLSPSILWFTTQLVFPGTSSLISKVFGSGLK